MTTPAELWISDHAVLRWLERVEGVNPDDVRARIRLAAKIGIPDQDGYIHFGKGSLAIENGKVTTVLGKGQVSGRSRALKRRRERQFHGARTA